MNLFDLSGKKAIVTGGGKGLGRAMAEALAEANVETLIGGSSSAVENAAAEMRAAGGIVHALCADLGSRRQAGDFFEKAAAKLGGRVDILVNNAGTTSRHPAEDFPLKEWDGIIELNLTTVFILSQLAGRNMLSRGKGKIINIASLMSFFGGMTVPAYAASKGGVAQLTRALSNEWASRGINVNAVAPGYMLTGMTRPLAEDPSRNREIMSRIPAGRWGRPDDLKGITIFLASDASDYVNGAIIPVDGGYSGR